MTALDRSSKFAAFASSLNKKILNSNAWLIVNINVKSWETIVKIKRREEIPGWMIEDLLKQAKRLKGDFRLNIYGEVEVAFKDA